MKAIHSASKQHGAALIIGLIFLLLMSIIGLSAMGNSTVQEQINGNTIHKSRTFQVAEEDLAAAEILILASDIFTQPYVINVIYDLSLTLNDNDLLDESKWDCSSAVNDKKCLTINSTDGLTSQAKVEYLSDGNNEYKFRVTVRTSRGRSNILLQSIYVR